MLSLNGCAILNHIFIMCCYVQSETAGAGTDVISNNANADICAIFILVLYLWCNGAAPHCYSYCHISVDSVDAAACCDIDIVMAT
jgi:hypothetical protein